LREELKLKVFESRVPRKIFGCYRDEVTGEWGRLCSLDLDDVYSSPNVIRVIKSIRMSWAGHAACIGERLITYRISVVEPEGNRPLVRPRCRCEGNS